MEKKETGFLLRGVFLLSFSALLLEVSLTRLFSVSKWYHFAFMVVSIALLGYSASGSFLWVFGERFEKKPREALFFFSFLASFSTFFSFVATSCLPIDPVGLSSGFSALLAVFLHYVLLSVPFFSTGFCVGFLFSKFPLAANRTYFYDLAGAGLGSVFFLFSAGFLPTPLLVAVSCVFSALACLLFSRGFCGKKTRLAFAWLIVLVFFAFAGVFESPVSEYKDLSVFLAQPGSRLLSTRWNSFSRVDVFESPALRFAPGQSVLYSGGFPAQRGVTVDGTGLVSLYAYGGDEDLGFTEYSPFMAPYLLADYGSALFLGAGTNIGLLCAYRRNVSSLVVVEENALLADAFRESIGDISAGFVFTHPRFFSTDERFDVVELALKENVFSGSAVHGFGENYLLTREAFVEYFSLLSDRGVFSVTRWLSFPPRGELRLVALAREALLESGSEDPGEHVFAFRTLTSFSLLVKKTPFSEKELEALTLFCERNRFDVVYAPNVSSANVNRFMRFENPVYYEGVSAVLEKNGVFSENYLFDVSSVSDEKPFFDAFLKWDRLGDFLETTGGRWEVFLEGGFLAVLIFFEALLLSVFLVVLPVWRKSSGNLGRETFLFLSYFFVLGAGFMFFELGLIHALGLFLGPPVFSFSIVLGALLVSSGLGSFYGQRLGDVGEVLPRILLLVCLFLFSAYLFLPLFFSFSFLPFLLKAAACFLVVFPAGFLMGLPFPLAVRLLAAYLGREKVALAWCVNGASSVLFSVFSIILAMGFGWFSVVLAGSFCYGACFFLSLFFSKK